MPQIRSKQILGQTPVNPLDLTTKQYVDDLIGSGSTLTIQDESLEVLTGVTVINFIGGDVSAMVGGLRQVNIFIPPVSYSPFFNAAGVSSITTYSRNISAPDSEGTPFKIGSWTAGTPHSAIRSSITPLLYNTTVPFNIINLTTTFDAILYDANGTTVLAQNTITLTGNTTIIVQNITLNITGWSADSDRYKAQISASFNLNSILPNGGRFSIRLVHHNNGTDYSFNQNDIFRDTENLSANISGGTLTVVTGSTVVTKQISGVYFYTTGTTWHVHLDQINNLNSRTFPTTQQLNIDETNFFISSSLNVNGMGGSYDTFTSGWSTLHSSTNAVYDKSNWTTNQTNNTNWSNGSLNNTFATATAYDWVVISPTVNSVNYNYLIDTFVDDSDRHSERFRRENQPSYPRLTSTLTTWDSTQSLNTYDSGTGLQIIGDRLVYPQYNFNSFEPNLSSQPNYSGLTGSKYYYRKFATNGNVVYNGRIYFLDYNITETDISTDNIKIELSTDGIVWLDFKYDFSLNLTGCRGYVDTYTLPLNDSIYFSFNNLAVNYTDNMYLRVTFSSSATTKYIGGMDILGDNWT